MYHEVGACVCSPKVDKRKFLSDVDVHLGKALKIVDPNAWLRLTRKWQWTGAYEQGQAFRATLVYDACRTILGPQLTMMRDFNRNNRVVGTLDLLPPQNSLSIFYGRRVRALDLKDRFGFKSLHLSPEVQVGFDLSTLEPTINVAVGDDEFNGLKVSPLIHPAVLASGAGLVAAMVHWRFPFSMKLGVASFSTGEGNTLELDLFTKSQREGDTKVPSTNLVGAMMTLRVGQLP